ncbi:hypothetical protein Airi02_034830 [Actinoallomurus iriomotensis]|uniref:Uncharacterized protein n=1 Tax=Actinoallomurus iriomotensis TaxID=478107 RepID=A0A9W6VZP2_9ACTN|nr:hypothetical protein Airi02_034830 [Actinoallomurus iriomotensis]
MNATTDGVVRDPSLFGTTDAWPSTIAAITEFVVPRSIPAAFGMTHLRTVPFRTTLLAVGTGRILNLGRPGW